MSDIEFLHYWIYRAINEAGRRYNKDMFTNYSKEYWVVDICAKLCLFCKRKKADNCRNDAFQ